MRGSPTGWQRHPLGMAMATYYSSTAPNHPQAAPFDFAQVRLEAATRREICGLIQLHWKIVFGIIKADVLDHFSQQV